MISGNIAVIMKGEEAVASFFDCDRVAVYSGADDGWSRQNTYYVNLEDDDPLSVRRLVRQIADSLGDCRVLAGSRIAGCFTGASTPGFLLFEINDAGPGR
jgi:hypothetical protein